MFTKVIYSSLESGVINMTEIEQKLLILQPEGPQGPSLGLAISGEEQFRKFDEAMGQLPESQRKDLEKIREVAKGLGVDIVKP